MKPTFTWSAQTKDCATEKQEIVNASTVTMELLAKEHLVQVDMVDQVNNVLDMVHAIQLQP
jgi:hypothetical protein